MHRHVIAFGAYAAAGPPHAGGRCDPIGDHGDNGTVRRTRTTPPGSDSFCEFIIFLADSAPNDVCRRGKKIFGFGKKFIRAGSCSAEKRYRKFATFQKLICRRFQRQEVIVYWPERFFLTSARKLML
jgi:hypothetical protein